MKARSLFVANPRSVGRSKSTWDHIYKRIRENVRSDFDVAFTERPQHATGIVRQGLRDGYTIVAAIGGDGSINEVVNGFFHDGRPINPEAALGIIPHGTGNDWAKTLRIPRDVAAAARLLETGSVRPVDVGKAAYATLSGGAEERYFINIADFGCGGLVVEKVNRMTKVFGGRVSFMWAIIATLASYRNQLVEFSIDYGKTERLFIQNFVVANGRFFGAGLCPAPEADPSDGWLDVICFGDFKLAELMLNFGRLRKGTHQRHPKVRSYRAKHIEATSKERVMLDIDGDLAGMLPAVFDIVPRALRVVAPPDLTTI